MKAAFNVIEHICSGSISIVFGSPWFAAPSAETLAG